MLYNDNNSGNSGVPQTTYPPHTPATPAPGYTPSPQYNGAQAPGYQPPAAQPAAAYPAPGMPGVKPTPKNIPDRKSVATKMIELVYLLLIILESVLALRFIFKLLGADPANIFIQFLYRMTLVFTYPFSGLFGTEYQNSIQVSQYNLEFTTLVAMGIYALIAYIIVRIIDIFR